MIDMITNPFYDNFMWLCKKSQRSIKLCAPYIKAAVFTDLFSKKRNGVSVDLITKVNLRDYHSNISDLEAMRQTLKNGGRVFNCSNLHAKIYLFDESRCIITSANLTVSGLKNNAECGLFTDDATIVKSALEFYNSVKIREDVGKITEREIGKISELLQIIQPAPLIEYPRLDLSATTDRSLSAISNSLSGWKKDVFLSLGQFGESFTSTEVSVMAQQLQGRYPRNNNREAKIRQVLQQLRDFGLVEFSSPGVYRKLWV